MMARCYAPAVTVTLPDCAWEVIDRDEDGKPTRFLAQIAINHVPMHLEAFAVKEEGACNGRAPATRTSRRSPPASAQTGLSKPRRFAAESAS